MNFENKVLRDSGIYYTRFIASFMDTGLNPRTNLLIFKAWLAHLKLTEEEIKEIANLVDNGKMELERDAKLFVKGISNVIEPVTEIDI